MRVTAVCITDVLVQLPASPGLCWCLLRPVQAAPRGTGSRRFNTSCRSSPAQRASLLSVQTVCHLSHRRLENLVKALDPPRECPSVSGLPAAEWEVPGCPAAHPALPSPRAGEGPRELVLLAPTGPGQAVLRPLTEEESPVSLSSEKP